MKPLPMTLRVPLLLGEECLTIQNLQAPMADMMSQAAGLGGARRCCLLVLAGCASKPTHLLLTTMRHFPHCTCNPTPPM